MTLAMRPLALLLAVAGLAGAESPAPRVRVPRASLLMVEKTFDRTIERSTLQDRFLLIGNTRGVYLDGYGVVFTAEVNLTGSAVISPFRPAFSKEEIAQLRQKKQERLPLLKESMKDLLVSSSALLDTVPEGETVVMAVCLFYSYWEDSRGLPTQVVVQAPRRLLLDLAHGRGNRAALLAGIKEWEQ